MIKEIDKRIDAVLVRITKKERTILTRRAKGLGMSLSVYLRWAGGLYEDKEGNVKSIPTDK
jgi:hypothetical protein